MQTVAFVAPRRTSLTALRLTRILPIALIVLCALAASSSPLWAQTLTVQIIQPDNDPFTVAVGVAQPFEAVAYIDGVELDYGAVTWDWSFGDATDDSTDNPTAHTYADVGNYVVTVTATYNGLQAQDAISAAVSPAEVEAGIQILPTPGSNVCDMVTIKIRIPSKALNDSQHYFGGAKFYKKNADGNWVRQYPTNDQWSAIFAETENGIDYQATSYLWDSAGDLNIGVNWKIEYFLVGQTVPPPATRPPDIVGSKEVTWTPGNTVVTSGTDVIFHHTGDTSHPVTFGIAHLACAAPQFNVTLSIYSLSGGATPVATVTPPGGYGIGAGQTITWDGKIGGADAPQGIYTYMVYAQHPAAPGCSDQDKSRTLTVSLPDNCFYWVGGDDGAGTLTAMVKYHLSRHAGNCCIRFYDGNMDPMATADNQSCDAGDHWSSPITLDALDEYGEVISPIWCVVSAQEDTDTAALNRGQDTKVALQCGTTTANTPTARLESVEFTNGEGVEIDGTGTTYSTPQWQDNSSPHDGDAGDPGDHRYPICYVRNSRPTVTATFDVLPADLASQVSSILIEGNGSGLTFPAASASVSGGQATLSGATSTTSVPDHVCWDNPLSIDWQASFMGGATWAGAGTSSNEAFITLEAPGCTFRTVLYLATKGGGTDAASCVSATWGQFSPRTVCAWDDSAGSYTRALHYYHTDGAHNITTAEGLLNPNNPGNPYPEGQCGAWAHLLQDTFSANGIASDWTTVLVPGGSDPQPPSPPTPGSDSTTSPATSLGFFVVKCNSNGNQPWMSARNGYTDDSYLIDFTINTHGPGAPGQNEQTPASFAFYNHYIVRQNGCYYDPSYGISAVTKHAYTNAAVDRYLEVGLVRSRIVPATGGFPAAPDLTMNP